MQRYDRLRTKKKRLDRCLDIIMWITLLGVAISVISGFMGGILGSVLYGDLRKFFLWLLDVAVYGVTIWAIYAKNVRFTAIAIAFSALAGGIELANGEAPYELLPLIATLIVDVQWAKLEKEEGFPLFDISFREYEEREKNQAEFARTRALEAGVRVASAEGSGDGMSDILDAGFDAPVIADRIGTNVNRFAGSSQEAVPQRAFTPGVMDSISIAPLDSEPDTPAPAAGNVNVPEIGIPASALPALDEMDAAPAVPPVPPIPSVPNVPPVTGISRIPAVPGAIAPADDQTAPVLPETEPQTEADILAALNQLGGRA